MRKIFERAGFLPLPLWERAGVRGILFLSVLIAAGSVAAFGQNAAPSATAKESRLMSSAFKKGFKKRKAELLTMLADYRAGKYTDIQGHAILFQVLIACGQLKEKQSPDCQSALKEYQALNKSHPEFQNPPEFHKKYPNLTASDLLNIELPSRKAAREAAAKKDQDIKEMAKNFVPKDTTGQDMLPGIYGYDHNAIFAYQYHLEFYKLPDHFVLKESHGPKCYWTQLFNESTKNFICSTDIGALNLKPFKIMTFQHRIVIPQGPPKSPHFIWVCYNLIGDEYTGINDEEQAILRTKYPSGEGSMPWLNDSADYKNFCGAISIDGKVIYQLPVKQRLPDTLFQIRGVNRSGTSVAIKVGEKTDEQAIEGGDIHPTVGNFRQVLIYTYPNKLEILDKKDPDKIQEALKVNGFGPMIWP